MKQLNKVLISYLVGGLFLAGVIETTWGGEKPSPGPFPVQTEVGLPFPPTHMAISDKNSTAYILSPISDATSYLARVDTQMRQLTDISNLTAKVTNLLLSAGGDKLYLIALASAEDQPPQVLILDTHQNKVIGRIALPMKSSPSSMVLSPDQHTLYVAVRPIHDPKTDQDYTGVLAINLSTAAIAYSVPLALEEGADLTITPDGTQVYMSTASLGGVIGFDTNTHEILSPEGATPLFYESAPQLAMSPEGNSLYLAGVEPSLYRDAITSVSLHNIHSGNQPLNQLTFPAQVGTPLLHLSRDGNIAYLIDNQPIIGKGNEINAVDLKTGAVNVMPVTDNQHVVNIKGITLSADGSMIYLIGAKQQGDTLNGTFNFVSVSPSKYFKG